MITHDLVDPPLLVTGAEMKMVRERHGIGLLGLASRARVSVKTLEGIEADRICGPPVDRVLFALGFVRSTNAMLH